MQNTFILEMETTPEVMKFYDEDTNTFSYVVKDPTSNSCAIIDSVLNFDAPSGKTSFEGADEIIAFINSNSLKLEWLIETHVHADHISAAPYLKSKLGGKIAIGEKVTIVQNVFGKVFNAGSDFAMDGSQFDHLFKDNEIYKIGNMNAIAMATPGHTPACMTHIIGNAAFVGDTIFMPDQGTARADFPGGDAKQLYKSIKALLSLPPQMRLFMCHDYAPNGREIKFETTIGDELANNIHVKETITENEFIKMRSERDKTLGMPRLILPSVQVNMRAGNFPEADDNGTIYLKLPINLF
ncbi:MAG: MBL fold metallo-hydrolase [Caulobacterales bacterium]|nr:MBL fold metallo-hydrolase [Caulobacterales bacterium]MCA0373570.1 MBL fold metallo-hydrolase [Pseudomonadota bacterium]